MKMSYSQIEKLYNTLSSLKNEKIKFKLGLILAKNLSILQQEYDFYVNQEREFAFKYLEQDAEGRFIESSPGIYRIKEGLQQECIDARKELEEFEADVNLVDIPENLMENAGIDFTMAQLEVLSDLIK